MRRLMLEGVAAADAAAGRGWRPRPTTCRAPRPAAAAAPPRPPRRPPGPRRRRPGGRRPRRRHRRRAGLARAAMALDSDACTALLRTASRPRRCGGHLERHADPGADAGSVSAGAAPGAASRSSTCSAECVEDALREVTRHDGPGAATPARCCWPPSSPRSTDCRWSRSPPPWPSARSRPGCSAHGCRPGRWPMRCRGPAPLAVFLWAQGAARRPAPPARCRGSRCRGRRGPAPAGAAARRPRLDGPGAASPAITRGRRPRERRRPRVTALVHRRASRARVASRRATSRRAR